MVDGESKAPDAAAASRVMETCKENGLLVGRGGLYGNVLRLSPPLIITEDDVARAVETLDVAFGEVQAGS